MSTDPLDPDDPGGMDADMDGVPDADDPDPTTADADGDRIFDFWEIIRGTNPADETDFPPLGDATGDGQVEFLDAIVVFNIFLGLFDPADFSAPELQDVNRDGEVEMTDAVIIFNFFLETSGFEGIPL